MLNESSYSRDSWERPGVDASLNADASSNLIADTLPRMGMSGRGPLPPNPFDDGGAVDRVSKLPTPWGPSFPPGRTDGDANRKPPADWNFPSPDRGPGPSNDRFPTPSNDRTGPLDRIPPRGDQISDLVKNAQAAFKFDQSARSDESFRLAVDSHKALAKGNEVVLTSMIRDWMGAEQSHQPLAHFRGTGVLAASIAEYRLEEGSRIDLKSLPNEKPRLFKGYDFDFGGEATKWFRAAAGYFVMARNYINNHMGDVIDGQKMDKAYLQQFERMQSGVEQKLEKIYGPHDVEGVYSEIRKQVRENAPDWQQGLVRMKWDLNDGKTTDPRFLAKKNRDVALGYLAQADYKSSMANGEDAQILYRDAMKMLADSKNLDFNAPDNHAVERIAIRLKPQIDKAIQDQWDNPFNNPFEIPNPNQVMV